MTDKTMKEVKRSSNFHRLTRIIEGMVGKKCGVIAFGYGGELHLHFGAKLSYENPKLSGRSKGEWRLDTCGTDWSLFTPYKCVNSDGVNEKVLNSELSQLENATLVRFEISIPNNILTVCFDNECSFRIIPDPKDDKYGLPYWRLFTPNRMVVSFGPGSRWSCRRSNVFAK